MVEALTGAAKTQAILRGCTNNSLVDRIRALQKRGLDVSTRGKKSFTSFRPAEIQTAVNQNIAEAETPEGVKLSPVQRLYIILGEISEVCDAIPFESPLKKPFRIPIADLVELRPAERSEYFGPMLTVIRLARVLENKHCITLTIKEPNPRAGQLLYPGDDPADANSPREPREIEVELLSKMDSDSLIPFLTHLRETAQTLTTKCKRPVSVKDIATALEIFAEDHPASVMGNIDFDMMIIDIVI
ncbi:MAG: hypothetical protein NT099_01495 [Candidatus Saganbacteria bacterium]|nr:hypothetical protein [Candidatus Saganbacteria bacterium]